MQMLLISNCLRIAVILSLNTLTENEFGSVVHGWTGTVNHPRAPLNGISPSEYLLGGTIGQHSDDVNVYAK